jgi:hypothetical protein
MMISLAEEKTRLETGPFCAVDWCVSEKNRPGRVGKAKEEKAFSLHDERL